MKKPGYYVLNEDHCYFLCQSIDGGGNKVVQIFQSAKNAGDSNSMILLASQVITPNIKSNV